MPSMSPAVMDDATDADLRRQSRKAIKRAISTLQASLSEEQQQPPQEAEEESPLATLDRAIAILQDLRNHLLGGSPDQPQRHLNLLPSPVIAHPSSSSSARIVNRHKRSSSDQYDHSNLPVWMRLRHNHNKPPRGYRVQYPGAWTTVTTIGGLQASSIFPNPSRGFTDEKLKSLTYDHLDWNYADHKSSSFSRRTTSTSTSAPSGGSPFISIFTDLLHAEDWAMKWNQRNSGSGKSPARILEIDCGKITRLLSVKEVVDSLGIVIEGLEPEQYEDEYLAVNQIPAEAILKESPVDFLVSSSSSDGYLMETRNDHENHDENDDDDDDHVHNIIIEGHEEDSSGMYFPPTSSKSSSLNANSLLLLLSSTEDSIIPRPHTPSSPPSSPQVRRFSPVRMNQRRSIILENGIPLNFGGVAVGGGGGGDGTCFLNSLSNETSPKTTTE